MYVACPHCQGWMVGDQIPVGAPVLCPHCQRQFTMTPAILAAAIHPEAPQTLSAPPSEGARSGAKASPSSPATASPQQTSPQASGAMQGSVLQGSAVQESASLAGPSFPPSPGPIAGAIPATPPTGIPTAGPGGMVSGGGPTMVGMTPATLPVGMPPAGASLGAPMSMSAPPVQSLGYPQTVVQPTPERVHIRPRRQMLGAEVFLLIGIAVMIVAVIIVVLLGYGPRPTAENIGKSAEPFSPTGPHMEIKYSSNILAIKNCDPFEWQEAEVRINADPEDDEGGYRCTLGRMPAGREKKILLNQCLSPSGTPFQGQIERVVVLAKTVDGSVRYLSLVGSAPPQ